MQLKSLLQTLQTIYTFPEGEGFIQTALPNVRLFWATEPTAATPRLHPKGIVIVFQGYKVGYLDDRVFRYDKNNYLMLTMPIPFECETFASSDEPLFGMYIDIDLSVLHELVILIETHPSTKQFETSSTPRAVEPVMLDNKLAGVAKRLLNCLCSPVDTDVLGASLVREILYCALLGENGHALYALTQDKCHCVPVAKALTRIHRGYAQPLTVEMLAEDAKMSVSTFHRAFKQITGDSPLQYMKKVRLNRAKDLILHKRILVGEAAYQVGYESPSQFSREFKRYFKVSPVEIKHVY